MALKLAATIIALGAGGAFALAQSHTQDRTHSAAHMQAHGQEHRAAMHDSNMAHLGSARHDSLMAVHGLHGDISHDSLMALHNGTSHDSLAALFGHASHDSLISHMSRNGDHATMAQHIHSLHSTIRAHHHTGAAHTDTTRR